MDLYLGVDVGSVTTKFVLIDEEKNILASCYLRTSGDPIGALKEGLQYIERHFPSGGEIKGVGSTGSARHLAGIVVGADIVKNEITAHAIAAIKMCIRDSHNGFQEKEQRGIWIRMIEELDL